MSARRHLACLNGCCDECQCGRRVELMTVGDREENHRLRMQRKKAVVDAVIAGAVACYAGARGGAFIHTVGWTAMVFLASLSQMLPSLIVQVMLMPRSASVASSLVAARGSSTIVRLPQRARASPTLAHQMLALLPP